MTSYELIDNAQKVALNAYAPFSKFKVGSAILSEKGHVYLGCNVENSSYGLTMCAERNAIFQGVAKEGPDFKIVEIAVICLNIKNFPPCGACLQVINEFAISKDIIIHYYENDLVSVTLNNLLPRGIQL